MTFVIKQKTGLLRSVRSLGVLGLLLALMIFGSDSAKSALQSVNAVITVDNVYQLCYGTGAPTSADITCVGADDNFITVEQYGFTPNSSDFIYIAAWSDETLLQGFLGQFSMGNTVIRTGDPGFQVCATGQDKDTLAQAPGPSGLAPDINNCNNASSNTSGWVAPVVGQQAPWLWAGIVGFDPAAGPGAELTKFTSPFPKWIWHDAGQAAQTQVGSGNPAWYGCNGSDRPFNNGCNHQEYLIFRLPVKSLIGACIQPPSGLEEWWPLDEASGNVVNNLITHPIAGHGPDLHNGIPKPGAIGGTGPAPIAGMVGGALQFDGVDDLVEVPGGAGTLSHQSPNSFTIDAWIKVNPNDASGVRPIVDKRAEVGGKVAGYQLYLRGGQLSFQLADFIGSGNICDINPTSTPSAATSCTNYESTTNVADGQWHFVAAVIDRVANQVRLYDGPANGALALVFTGPARANAANNAALRIGSNNPAVSFAGQFFKGAIDEVEIFKRALSQQEIQDIFNAGSAGKCKPAPSEATADLGDAPDSSNHSGKAMDAYPTVPAKFPTVFDPATGLPQGPKHLQPKGLAWLGPDVCFENEADLPPDCAPGGVTNIDPPTNAANRDEFDDGVALPIAIPMICGQTQFKYTVTSTAAAKLYVNVWFDFNRDGDWDDPIQKCPLGPAITGSFTEWAVQNEVINVVPGLNGLTTPVFGAANPTRGSEMWMRITLTDQPIAAANGADGSGPAGGYKYGETEDYLLRLAYSELCGIKFNDLNGNGKQDPGEPGLANWVIEVKDANGNIIGYAVTDANGRYCIVVPSPGIYTVSEQQQQGWTQTAPSAPGTYTVTVPPAHTNLNFGNQEKKEGKAEICVFKFEDLNGNGVRDPNEPLLGGWQFTVSPAPLSPATSPVTTLPGGGICFGVSAAGTYTITELVQSGWAPTTPNPQTVTVSPNQLANVFFGNKKKEEKFEICGIKFNDLNGNGVYEPNPPNNEPGLPGWTINAVTGPPAALIDIQATTNANGQYCFIGLAPGTYTISETLQPGWVQTFPPSPGKYTVTVPPSVTNINFGNKKEAGVCDREIKKTVTPNPVQSGGTVTITLTVTNVGTIPCPVVAGINVADPKPTGMTFNPPVTVGGGGAAGWSCGISGPSGAWPGGVTCTATNPLLPGAANAVTITFTATVTAPAGSQVPNCAEVTNVGDANPIANNKSCVTINVAGTPCRDVTINLSTGVAPWTVSPGTVGVITNLGPLAGTWVAPSPGVRWIQPTNQATPQMLPGGFYQYSVPFTLPGPLTQYSTITLTGRYAADNTVHQFFVGPVSTGPGAPLCQPANANCFSAWTPFNITSGFAAANTLNVRVYNNPTGQGGPTYTGLAVEATLRAVCRR